MVFNYFVFFYIHLYFDVKDRDTLTGKFTWILEDWKKSNIFQRYERILKYTYQPYELRSVILAYVDSRNNK